MRSKVKRVVAASVALMAAGAMAFPGTATAGGHGPAQPHRPTNGFSADGPWNTRLPTHVRLAPNSAAVVANLVADRASHYNVWALNSDTWSAPIYTVGRHVPTTTWRYDNCSGSPDLFPGFGDALAAVPTLPEMVSSQGTDNEIAIYQPSTDTYWDFWRATRDGAGRWSACWGGKIEHYSRNPGIFANPLGATATGLPLGAFLIRISELQRGHIDHAVSILTPGVRANCTSWPANRNDGRVDGVDQPCEGQRFRLDPSFDTDTLATPAGRVIAKAMQQYGLIMTDYAGALSTQAEDPRPYMAKHGGVNPYDALVDPNGDYPAELHPYLPLNDVPVDRLQALPLDYGKPRH